MARTYTNLFAVDEANDADNILQKNYENFANAIIISAANDYKKYYRKIRELKAKKLKAKSKREVDGLNTRIDNYYENIKVLRNFFESEYFMLLSNADGKMIADQIERMEGRITA